MAHSLTLKDWTGGATPDKNDLVSWSNLIYQRSLQVKSPQEDPVSAYFFSQWLTAEKPKALVAPLFSRTFSEYNLSFQIAVMDKLDKEGAMKPVDHIPRDGLLKRRLIMTPDVWAGMNANQFRDHLHYHFHDVFRLQEQEPNAEHGAWNALGSIKSSKERATLFRDIVGPRIMHEFGFLNDEEKYFGESVFHGVIARISEVWGIHPCQVMYALIRQDPSSSRDHSKYVGFIEPYANDIRELIQFSTKPLDERIRRQLPASSRPLSIDGLVAFAISADPSYIFVDQREKNACGGVRRRRSADVEFGFLTQSCGQALHFLH